MGRQHESYFLVYYGALAGGGCAACVTCSDSMTEAGRYGQRKALDVISRNCDNAASLKVSWLIQTRIFTCVLPISNALLIPHGPISN